MCEIIDFQKKKKSFARRIAPLSVRSRELDRAVMHYLSLGYEGRKKLYDEAVKNAEACGVRFYFPGTRNHQTEEYRFLLDAMSKDKTKKQIKELVDSSNQYYTIR